jgi:hypothetical protein
MAAARYRARGPRAGRIGTARAAASGQALTGHPTLMKLITRRGAAAVDGCNEALLAIAAAARRVQAAGGATRTRVRDCGRSAGARARAIGAKPRLRAAQTRDEAQAVVRRITGELRKCLLTR